MILAKENKLDVELVHTTIGADATADYKKINKLGQIPTFVGADNFVLTEVIAIAVYCESRLRLNRATMLHDDSSIQIKQLSLSELSNPVENCLSDQLFNLRFLCLLKQNLWTNNSTQSLRRTRRRLSWARPSRTMRRSCDGCP